MSEPAYMTDAERAAMNVAANRVSELGSLPFESGWLCARRYYTSQARPPLDFTSALAVAQSVFDQYAVDQRKWWKRMDGTPILNDVAVRMAQAFLDADPASAPAPAADTLDAELDQLIARLQELAGYKYQYHTAHLPIVLVKAASFLTALRARVAELERGRAGLLRAAEDLQAGLTNVRVDRDALAAQVERLTKALLLACNAMRAPLDGWKGEVERKALDAARVVLAQLTQEGICPRVGDPPPDAAGAGEG